MTTGSERPAVVFKRLRPDQDGDLALPRYMTSQASGMDIQAAVGQPLEMPPGAIVLVPTGFAMALPEGYEAQIRPRSGLAVKHGIGLINAPGTIDADYRGEVMVALVNLGGRPFTVKRGDRIAQMVIQKVYRLEVVQAEKLDETARNDGGFGHTGLH
jgi:dUTP pyrophosphatase